MSLVKFSDVVQRANTKEDKDNTDKIYYVGGEHIDSNNVLITERGIIKGSTIGPMFYFGFKAGQVLFVSRNPHLRKAGMVTFDGICSEKTFVLETKNENILLQKFLPFVMQSNHFWNYMESHKSGSVNYFINWSTLANYKFELPDIDEQKRLTELLWAIKDTKYAYEKLSRSIDEVVKSQFIEMFNGKYSSTLLEDISIKWLKGQALKKDAINEAGCNTCIHYGELFTKYGPIINKVSSKTDVEPVRTSEYGDILFPASDVTPAGLTKCSAILCDGVILGGDIIAMRPKKDINPAWLSFAIRMQKDQLLSRITGSVIRHISAKSLKTVEIPMAPRKLQNEFEMLLQQSDKSKFEIKQCIETTEKLLHRIIDESIN